MLGKEKRKKNNPPKWIAFHSVLLFIFQCWLQPIKLPSQPTTCTSLARPTLPPLESQIARALPEEEARPSRCGSYCLEGGGCVHAHKNNKTTPFICPNVLFQTTRTPAWF